MLQLIIIITSMKKGTFSWALKLSKFWMGSTESSTKIPISFQQSLAKEHHRNRCSLVSSVFPVQSTQLKEGNCRFFLRRMLRVLNRSWTSNQKNSLCLCWHEDFYIHLKIGWAPLMPFRWRYAFLEEKRKLHQIYVHVSLSTLGWRSSNKAWICWNWS